MNARELTLDVLLEMEKSGTYANALIRDVLNKYDYEDPREKAFFKRLTESTLERRITLDWVINCFSKTPVQKMKPLIRNLLRLSACQILYMENIPDSAACNEAVKLAKQRSFSSLSGFVNGVLRSVAKNKNSLRWPDKEKETIRYLSVFYGYPEWMLTLWQEQYGKEGLEEKLKYMTLQRPVTLRMKENLGSEDVKQLLKAFEEAGIAAKPHLLYESAYELGSFEGVAALPGYEEGFFYAQDVSSMLAVNCAGIKPGMKVLDLCSAPGGKAVFASEKAGEKGQVRAGDVSENKTDKIRENAGRMGCDNLEICVWDATQQTPSNTEWADVMLADVPCSGLGVMGRKKDIRYRVQKEDLEALAALQKEIITASWRYVKPGGVLLYSTCTVDRMENEGMVKFITENFPFETESLDPYLPGQLCSDQTKMGMLQLWPGEHGTDGFFMARLRRKG